MAQTEERTIGKVVFCVLSKRNEGINVINFHRLVVKGVVPIQILAAEGWNEFGAVARQIELS